MKTLQQHIYENNFHKSEINEKLVINNNYKDFRIKVKDLAELSEIIHERQKGKINNYLDLSDLDISEIDSFDMLFAHYQMSVIDLSGWNTENVTTMAQMFFDCDELTDIIGIEDFNLKNVKDMNYMFAHCKKLDITEKIKYWRIDPRKINTVGMFNKCSKTKFNYTDLSK